MTNTVLERFNLDKNILFSIVGFVSNTIFLFVGYRLVAAELGVEGIGLWAVLFSLTNLIKIGDPGSGHSALKFVASCTYEKDEPNHLLKTYILSGFLINFCFLGALIVPTYFLMVHFLPDLIDVGDVELSLRLIPLMLSIFFMRNMTNILLGSLRGLHFGYLASLFESFGALIAVIGMYYWVPRLGLIGLSWAYILQSLVTFTICLFYMAATLKVISVSVYSLSTKVIKQMLLFSIKIQFSSSLNGIWEPLIKFLVYRSGGSVAVGFFELALKTVVTPRNALMAGLSSTLAATVSLYTADKESLISFYRKQVSLFFIFNCIMTALVLTLSPIVPFVILGQFSSMYWWFVFILAIGYVANAFSAPAYNLGLVSGLVRWNIYSLVIQLTSMTLLAIMLGRSYGVYGVLIGSTVAQVFACLLLKIYNEKTILLPRETLPDSL